MLTVISTMTYIDTFGHNITSSYHNKTRRSYIFDINVILLSFTVVINKNTSVE